VDSLCSAHRLRLPMRVGCGSLHLPPTAAVAAYAAWRQHGFA
ncbi:tRNA (uridine(34)/cytosine(34)/5-carboxymethylaminomethyluridine(34)-2'-O)-methyltransferase TrmL, partial [Pseudomonas syringae]